MDYQEAVKTAKECEGVSSPMPQYQCHKKVWALRIKQVIRAPLPTIEELQKILDEKEPRGFDSAGGFIVPEDHFAPIAVSTKFMERHGPEAGGYLVFYEDGYRSFSPAKATEHRQRGCQACDFTGWRQVIRGGYSGVERCGCQA
jgi:hypothetical protein